MSCSSDVNHRIDSDNSPYNYVFPRAKALALFQFFQTGIPIIYNGEEIGMDNNQELILKANEPRDKSVYLDPSFLSSIDLQSRYSTVWHRSEDPTMDNLPFWSTAVVGRDNVRTPMQ